MYAVAFYYHSGKPQHRIYPNVFPDLDMAIDCVLYQIQQDHGVTLTKKELKQEEDDISGQHTYYFEHGIYVIGKLFNFNPKGL